MNSIPELSIIVPTYGCGSCLSSLHARLISTLSTVGASYEIIFVDDRSPDDAWETIREISRADPAVKGLRLSRNFGQHAAITAGLQYCKGEWAFVMDCDLQDPPEEIPNFLKAARSGFDIVFGRRKEKKHSLFRRVAAYIFFGVVNLFNKTHMQGDYGSFSIISC